MLTFPLPAALNGLTLRRELQEAGLPVSNFEDAVIVSTEQLILSELDESHRAAAAPVVEGHDPADLPPGPSIDSLVVAARITVTDKVKGGGLDDATIALLACLFVPWEPGETYALGDVRQWDATLIECIQAHTNNDPSHTPDVTPALWKVHRTQPTGGYPAWRQPESTDPYNATWDDGTGPVVVEHPGGSGDLWVNVHGDGNIWEPGEYGWNRYYP